MAISMDGGLDCGLGGSEDDRGLCGIPSRERVPGVDDLETLWELGNTAAEATSLAAVNVQMPALMSWQCMKGYDWVISQVPIARRRRVKRTAQVPLHILE